MSYFEFPHTRTYEGDLGYIIAQIEKLTANYNQFYALNKIKVADPIEWDISTWYESYTIVTYSDNNATYISKKPVPSGVAITNSEYWEYIGSLVVDADARTGILNILKFIADAFEATSTASTAHAIGDFIISSGKFYKVINTINLGDTITPGVNVLETTVENMVNEKIAAAAITVDMALNNYSLNPIANKPVANKFDQISTDITSLSSDVANIDAVVNALNITVTNQGTSIANLNTALNNEVNTRMSEDGLLSARIDAIASLPEGSTAGDAELMDIRISEQNNEYASAGASVRAQANKNQTTSTFVTYTRSQLVNNGWVNNSGVYPQPGDSWQYSNAIDISAFSGTQLYIYFTATGLNGGGVLVNNISFFDKNDVFLYGIAHPSAAVETTWSGKIEMPKFAKYMRICSKNDDEQPFFVSLYKRPAFTPADPCSVINDYIHKDIITSDNDDGYLDTSGVFQAASPATWHTSVLKYVGNFNKAYYKLNCNNAVAAIALYRGDQTCIKVVSGSSGSYTSETGIIDISEAIYIKYCFHNDYTDTNLENHVILFNEPAYNKYTSGNYHVLNKPFDFYGKYAMFFGDSITEGVVTPGTVTPNGFPKVFSNMVGMSYTNKGVSGASITRVTGYPCILDTIAATSLTGVDFVFIMGGVNDWQLGVTIGDFQNAVQDICDQLSTFTGKIIFIAPIDTAGRKPINEPDADLDTFRQALKEVVLSNGHSFVNGKLFDMPTALSSQTYINDMFGDTIHPSEAGYNLIARGLRTALLDSAANVVPPLLEDSESGSTANFDTSIVAPLKELVVDVDYIQATGTPTPLSPIPITVFSESNIVRCGSNIWDEEWELGNIDDSGQLTPTGYRIRTKNFIPCKPSTTYYFKTGLNIARLFYYDENENFISLTVNPLNITFTTPSNCHFLKFRSADNITEYDNSISINYPSNDTVYHAYDGQVYNIPFGQTIGSGLLNVITGVLIITHEYIASYNGETITEPWVSSMDEYIPNTTPTTGAQVVYQLATPTTIQLTPTEVKTLMNTNNVFSDTGDVYIKYLETIQNYIDKRI